jgi:hypothetical protein
MHIVIAITVIVLVAIPVGILMLSLIADKSTGYAAGDTYCNLTFVRKAIFIRGIPPGFLRSSTSTRRLGHYHLARRNSSILSGM